MTIITNSGILNIVSTQSDRVLTTKGDDMPNNERKYDILYAIIKDYIKYAEPIGSRTIEKKCNLGISSATIRNEMADLEELGYLVQPHTSAGRIPSDKAYRLYVDQFMKVNKLDDFVAEDVRNVYNRYLGELNEAINKTAEMLTKLTNLTALVTTPNLSSLNIKHISIIHIEKEKAFLVIITKQSIVKNRQISFTHSVTSTQLEKITNFLNACINGISGTFDFDSFTKNMDELDYEHQALLSEVLDKIKSLLIDGDNSGLISNGITKIFSQPEFKDLDKAKSFLDILHKKDIMSHLLYDVMSDGVNIKIGNEIDIEELKDCSIVTATYKLNGRPIGTIGLLGPTRLDYDNCVSVINSITNELSYYLSNSIGGDD